METKKAVFLWAASLFVIGTATVVLAGSRAVGIRLPDLVIRVAGLCELAALPVFGFSTVIRIQNRRRS